MWCGLLLVKDTSSVSIAVLLVQCSFIYVYFYIHDIIFLHFTRFCLLRQAHIDHFLSIRVVGLVEKA